MKPLFRAAPGLACALLALTLAGCVSKSAHDELQAQLDSCQQGSTECSAERDRLAADLDELQDEQQRVLEQWRAELGITSDGTEAFRNDVAGQVDLIKTRITDELPDMVRAQLGKDLEQLTTLLDQQYSDIDRQVTEVLGRLVRTQESLEDANRSLERAEIRLDAIESTGAAIRQDIATQRLDTATLNAEVSAVAAQIEDFNYRYFLCKDCPEYLGIRRKRQDEIIAFHADLLAALRRVTGIAPAGSTADTSGADEEGQP